MRKYIISTAFAMVASVSLAANLKICVEGAYPPFSESKSDGSVVGFDIDIANALCKNLGHKCEMVKTDWDGIIPALTEKKCDAIVASMSITPERAQKVDFSKKYYQTPAAFVAKKGTKLVDTPEGLKGKKVGVQRGTIHEDYLNKKYASATIKLYATQDEVYADLMAGRLDAAMSDKVETDLGFLAEKGKGKYEFFGKDHLDPAIHGEGAGIAVRKGDKLKDDFSKAIDAIRKSGEYTTIMKKYFPYDIFGG
jgi:polar amino acid transport system substrate-binding protein/arginine/ornithine transport system substrate-binding protein